MRQQLRDDQWKRIESLLPQGWRPRAQRGGQPQSSSRRCCGSPAPAVPGATCQQEFGSWNSTYQRFCALVTRRRGTGCLRRLAENEAFARLHRLHHRSSPPSMPLALKTAPKRSGDPGRLDDQDSRRGRCHRAAHPGPRLGRPSPRHHPGRRAARGRPGVRGGRQGLRRDGAATADRRPCRKAVIPPRANRRELIRWSKAVYRHRNLVERFFCRIKHFRRIAARYDKLVERFASFISPNVAAIVCST